MAVLAIAALVPALAAECEKPARLRFSMVPQGDVRKDAAALKPLFDDLHAALGMPIDLHVPSSYGGAVEGLLSGAVHIARLGPAAYVAAKSEDAQLTAFATYSSKANSYQEEGPFYYSLLIVRDAHFTDLQSLYGKNVVLVDPNSTSGALVPRHDFAKKVDLPLEKFFQNIVYSGSHDRSLQNLIEGHVDAAFIGSSNLASAIASHSASNRQGIRVLWRSTPIPRDPFVLRGQLCADIKKKIRAVFLDSEGRSNARSLGNLGAIRFVAVQDQDYALIRQIYLNTGNNRGF